MKIGEQQTLSAPSHDHCHHIAAIDITEQAAAAGFEVYNSALFS